MSVLQENNLKMIVLFIVATSMLVNVAFANEDQYTVYMEVLDRLVRLENNGGEVVALKDELADVKQELSTVTKELATVKQELSLCKDVLEKVDIKTLTKEKRLLLNGESKVAFQASLSNNLANLGLHQAIHFDKVDLNEGDGYSVHAGEFVAPVSGLYVFAWTISSADRTCMKFEVVKNSIVQSYSISDSNDHNDWAISSGTLVTRMNVKDRVWVRVSDFAICSHTVYGTGFGTSTFSGFLLS